MSENATIRFRNIMQASTSARKQREQEALTRAQLWRDIEGLLPKPPFTRARVKEKIAALEKLVEKYPDYRLTIYKIIRDWRERMDAQ